MNLVSQSRAGRPTVVPAGEICDMLLSGRKPFEIVSRLPEVSNSVVTYYRQRLGMSPFARGRRPGATKETITLLENAEELHRTGLSFYRIAKHLGITKQCLNQMQNPEKVRARKALFNAVRDGKLVRPPRCGECGEKSRIEAHHPDYSKPLNVEWLCVECHARNGKAKAA